MATGQVAGIGAPSSAPLDGPCSQEQPAAAQCLDTASACPSTTAVAVVLDKLAGLDVARKAERERRREESRAAADPRESVAQFLKSFASRQRNVDQALKRMLASHQDHQQQQEQQQSSPSLEPGQQQQENVADPDESDGMDIVPLVVSTASPEQIQASLELVSAEVVSLEQAAAAASYYLPAYDQKQCAATIASLRAFIEAARTALVPRRRFVFGSKKVNKVRGEEVSTAAAAMATAATTGSGNAAATTAAGAATVSAAPEPTAVVHSAAPGAVTACSSGRDVQPQAAPPETSTAAAAGHHAAVSITSSTAKSSAAAKAAVTANDAVPAALTVSEQDRGLVARGRGLLGLTDATIVLSADEVSERGAGGDFVLLGLTRCRVVLLGRLRALRIANLRSCTVVSGPVTGACFVDDVRGSSLSLATHQVRVHRTHATDLFLRVRSKPIIEHSTGIRVAPWAAAVAPEPRLEQLLQANMLGEETGCWQKVDDFGWIKAVQSPNWCVMPPEERPQELLAVPPAVWEEQRGEATADGVVAVAGGGGDDGEDAAVQDVQDADDEI